MLRLLKPISSCSRNKNLFDSINKGVLKVPSCLFLIFCRFYVNKGDIISPSSCGTHANVRDLFIATAAKHVPKSDLYASAISVLEFSNVNLEIFLPVVYATPASTQIQIGMGSSLDLADIN